jgi:diguanylate cyclase
MNRLAQILADALRKPIADGGEDIADVAGEASKRSGGELLLRKRLKVAVFAILFGVISGITDLPLPVEDFYRAVRAELRSRPAPQDIAFIAIDDKTLTELDGKLPSRLNDSQLLDNLFAGGVNKVAFDRAHADPESPTTDAAFSKALEKHGSRVWLGFAPQHQIGFQVVEELAPREQFRRHVNLAAMNGRTSPFGMSIVFATHVTLGAETHPSLSAVLGNYSGPDRLYRPDYAFDPATIPTFSYVDVLSGKVPKSELSGKSVIIGEGHYQSSDFFRMPLRSGRFAGAYFHIMGAHTLKRGVPTDLIWYPAMLMVGLAIFWQVFVRSKSTRALTFVGGGLLLLPFTLDGASINIDVISAALALCGAAFGFKRINSKYYSADVDAMTPSAIGSNKANVERDVYALKIASLSEMSEDWSANERGEFINSLITYVKGPGDIDDVAFERDVLVWLAPCTPADDLERHVDGLAMMLKTAISHDWQSSSNAPALGIDTNYALPLGQRIKKAMQAAEDAAARGVRFIINDAAYLEARNSRMEMTRLLERGLRDRSIGVAYQPKIELATGRIVGAETLIRWQPDGIAYVNPLELVLAAEASDRINELTLLVMESALVEGKHAIAVDPGFKLAVNMSAKSLSDTHLLFDIMTMIGRHAFPPENLTLELTETAKLEDANVAPQIAALKARGICLSIDDFGTGQSNLEYIEKLPSSELKIDRRFVQHLETSEESRAVVRATIEIAHSLGKVVVAEGVEETAVADTLRAMGCDQAQGYLFSHAISMPALLAMMGETKSANYG